jgi:hypothetical protein
MNQRQRMRSRLGFDARESTATKDFGNKDSRRTIDLRIDRLVLAGLPAGERFRIAEAMNQELTRILSEQGLPSILRDSTDHDRLDAGSISLERGASGETMGSLIARAVYRGIDNTGSNAAPARIATSPNPGNLPKPSKI